MTLSIAFRHFRPNNRRARPIISRPFAGITAVDSTAQDSGLLPRLVISLAKCRRLLRFGRHLDCALAPLFRGHCVRVPWARPVQELLLFSGVLAGAFFADSRRGVTAAACGDGVSERHAFAAQQARVRATQQDVVLKAHAIRAQPLERCIRGHGGSQCGALALHQHRVRLGDLELWAGEELAQRAVVCEQQQAL
jgi:hypothetical protein